MKKNILLVGASLVSGNKGVNALTRGAILGLLDYQESPTIKILSYTAKEKINHIFYDKGKEVIIEEIPLRNKYATILNPIIFLTKSNLESIVTKSEVLNEIYSCIKWADIVLDISEGDSFSDIYGMKRFVMHSNIKLIAIHLDKDLILLPQTMGPFKNKVIKKVTKYICNNAKHNFARDMISYQILSEDIGIKPEKIKYCSDLAFYMKPNEKVEAIELRQKIGSDILVGINISGLLYNGGYSKKNMFGFKSDYSDTMHKIIEMFLRNYSNVQIVLIPHVIVDDFPVEDDLVVCKNMYAKFNGKYPERVHCWENYLREDEIKGILGKCDFFIGGRMHSCIGAISSGVPTSPIAYSRKFIGIWEQFGLEKFVADPRKQSSEEILKTIKESFDSRETAVDKIKSTNIRFNNELINMFSTL